MIKEDVKKNLINFSFIWGTIFGLVSIVIVIFLIVQPTKETPESLTNFDTSDVKGKIVKLDHRVGSFYLRTSDHPNSDFSFAVIPDGELPRIYTVISVGDSLIKEKASELILIKTLEGKEYSYKFNRWFAD